MTRIMLIVELMVRVVTRAMIGAAAMVLSTTMLVMALATASVVLCRYDLPPWRRLRTSIVDSDLILRSLGVDEGLPCMSLVMA